MSKKAKQLLHGSLLAIAICAAASSQAIEIMLDFSLDERNAGWFSASSPAGAARRQTVQAAADFLSSIIVDDDWEPLSNYDGRFALSNMQSSTLNGFSGASVAGTAESNGPGFRYIFDTADSSVGALAANQYVVHMIGLDHAPVRTASGAWFGNEPRTPASRAGNEFSTWGGVVNFNTTIADDFGVDWYVGETPGVDPREDYGWQRSDKSPTGEFLDDNWRYSSGQDTWIGYDTPKIDQAASGRLDLYQIAVHELIHALGLTSANFESFVGIDGQSRIVGANAVQAFGGPVPYDPSGHVPNGVQSTVWGSAGILSEALMAAQSRRSFRRYLTELDAALLRDLGYDVIESETLSDLSISGDYNRDGVVDAADYTIWRDSVGQSLSLYSGADGSGDGLVSSTDYSVWRDYFGETSSSTRAVSLPEPTTLLLAAAAVVVGGYKRR